MIFVTGGTGLVGARLIFDLINEGKDVTALIRPETLSSKFSSLISFYTNNAKAIEDKVTWVEGDLSDIGRLIEIIPKNSKVYHCAAEVSFNPKEDKKIINTNVDGTANLINACLINNIIKLCHVSSIGALGSKTNGEQISENTPWSADGKSAYSLSKYYSELEVWRGMVEGLSAVIVNPAVILGPGNWEHGSPQLFSMIWKKPKYYTKGTTGYVDVKDVTKAMIMLMNSDIQEERFVVSSETLSIKELFEKIAISIKVKAPYKYASKNITGLAYRLERFRSSILKTNPKLTKQTHKVAHSQNSYSGEKIKGKIDFSYTPITDTINFIGSCFLNERTKH